jgi:hypothetical protein
MQTRDEPGGGEHVRGHARHSRAHSGPRHHRHSRLRQLRAAKVLNVVFVYCIWHSGPRHYRHSRLRQLRAAIVLNVVFVYCIWHSGPRHYRHSRLRQLRAEIFLKSRLCITAFFHEPNAYDAEIISEKNFICLNIRALL